jgi:hypothetical protein
MTIRSCRGALVALAVLATASCSTQTTEGGTGTGPWEVPASAPAEWPAWPDTVGTVGFSTGSRMASGDTPAHYWAHARVHLASPIADVWTALQWKPGVLVAMFPDYPLVDCEATAAVEPTYEVSFELKETSNDHGQLGRLYPFYVRWRAQATRDAATAITQVNVRGWEYRGHEAIALMRQSVVVTPAADGGTRLEIVRHINAPDETEVTAADWIRLYVQGLDAQLKGTRESLIPTRWCFP